MTPQRSDVTPNELRAAYYRGRAWSAGRRTLVVLMDADAPAIYQAEETYQFAREAGHWARAAVRAEEGE